MIPSDPEEENEVNKYFDVTDKVYDITERYPEVLEVLVSNGFEQLKNEALRKTMGKGISLEMALRSKKLNVGLFEEKLVEAIEQNRVFLIDSSLAVEKKGAVGDVRIEGVLPCPIRIPLVEHFESFLKEKQKDLDYTVGYDLKSANLGIDWIKDRVKTGKEEELSEIFMSAGFDLFFDKELMGQFKEKDVFHVEMGEMNPDFANDYLDLRDPKGQYVISGVVPAILMVNKDELKGRAMPKTWADILKPEFENSVSLPMQDLDLFNAVVIHIYKFFGEEGIRSLARSYQKNLHPAQMVKAKTTKASTAPAISIAPYFFTQMLKENGPTVAVWPEDGAIISPIFLLAKKSKMDKIKIFVDYFLSKEVGQIMSANGKFPSTNPEVNNHLSQGQKFLWVGWDFIHQEDIGGLIRHCEDVFHDHTI